MSMNVFMHPRNIYKNRPDFQKLGEENADFKKFVIAGQSGKPTIDFSNKEAVRALTKALLAKDFDLQVEIPENKLIPTLPLRLNYLLWIEDLLRWKKGGPSTQTVHGIDIGTGASCIYPLLASKINQWKMTGTETDPDSVKCAVENATKNNLSSLITVLKVDSNQILSGVIDEQERYDFCMCNPPFFSSESEVDSMTKARSPHRDPPRNAFSGSSSELVVHGGELEFVKRIIADSKQLNDVVRVYTTMVGHKKNANSLVKELEVAGAKSISRTEFCQGNTTRWGIAWTFCQDLELPSSKQQAVHNKKLLLPMELIVPETIKCAEYTVFEITTKILDVFKSLQFSVKETLEKTLHKKSKKTSFEVTAQENTWSNQRKKRREQKFAANNNKSDSEPDAKRQKLSPAEDQSQASSSSASDPVLTFKMDIGIAEKKIFIKLAWTGGLLGRDSLHQILQYLKNAFNQ